MVDATPTKPFCYAQPDWHRRNCTYSGCAYWLACGAQVKGLGSSALPRKIFVQVIAGANLPRDDAIAAIQKAYGITRGAARKQFDRWRKKLGYPQ